MRKVLFIFVLFLLVGCAHQQQTSYPSIERAIYLNSDLLRIQQEYDTLYQFIDVSTQESMRENIMPVIFELRNAVNLYTEIVLMGSDDPELYFKIQNNLRRITLKMSEVVSEHEH